MNTFTHLTVDLPKMRDFFFFAIALLVDNMTNIPRKHTQKADNNKKEKPKT